MVYTMYGFSSDRRFVLLIDDDCALPPNFSIAMDPMADKIKCIRYTRKMTSCNNSINRTFFCQWYLARYGVHLQKPEIKMVGDRGEALRLARGKIPESV